MCLQIQFSISISRSIILFIIIVFIRCNRWCSLLKNSMPYFEVKPCSEMSHLGLIRRFSPSPLIMSLSAGLYLTLDTLKLEEANEDGSNYLHLHVCKILAKTCARSSLQTNHIYYTYQSQEIVFEILVIN
jgi:hypothetical protein